MQVHLTVTAVNPNLLHSPHALALPPTIQKTFPCPTYALCQSRVAPGGSWQDL